jgi:hypothetical protein
LIPAFLERTQWQQLPAGCCKTQPEGHTVLSLFAERRRRR